MLYSVWNPGTRGYDYYETREPMTTANVAKPMHLRARKMGSTPEQAAWPLPAHARRVGQGEHARGFVASPGGAAVAGASNNTGLVKIGLLALSALLLWRYAR